MELKIQLHDPNAILPSRTGEDEVGYDLTAIKFHKRLSNNTFMYDTGISVEPPKGYYVEIIPRSSIVKSGYILGNSIGIIDPSYRGTLKIVLIKVSDSKRPTFAGREVPLVVPFTLCQLVIRKMNIFPIKVVNELESTYRGNGGFGSTNK